MSSPRPASARLLPSALPHERESSSSASPHRLPTTMQSPAAYEQAGSYGTQGAGELDDSSFPPIQPFFTLVEDSNTQSTVHPSVSYIFADDDQDPITNAAIRIDATPSQQYQQQQHQAKGPKRLSGQGQLQQSPGGRQRRGSVQAGGGGGGSGSTGTAPAPIERCILVTLAPDGRSVASATSLTPDWHVDGAELSIAPTLDGDAGLTGAGTSPGALTSRLGRVSSAVAAEQRADETVSTPMVPDGPLMLRIHGSGVPGSIGREEALGMGIDGLCETFKERLNELRRVVEAAERDGQEDLDDQEDQEDQDDQE